MPLSKIMAVIDPTLEQQPAFERAVDSAVITNASLHLYVCVNDDYGDGGRDEVVATYRERLEILARRARDKKVDTECEVDWSNDWREQIVVAGRRSDVDLIIKHSLNHSVVDRSRRTTADWNLLRRAECPVLMIKDHTVWENRRVLAAIVDRPTDPMHTILNEQVIAFANDFAESYQSDVHFVVGFNDRNSVPDASRLAKLCSTQVEKVHVVHGQIDRVIGRTASEIDADLIVIGTAGRSGIRGTIVGNTSERLLDHTDCDVLVLH